MSCGPRVIEMTDEAHSVNKGLVFGIPNDPGSPTWGS
jgi:hypothetical protein